MINSPIRKTTRAATACILAVGLSVGSVGVASAHGRGGGSAVTDESVITAITDVALAEVPDATIVKIKQSRRGAAAYEVALIDSNGSRVRLYLDADYTVLDTFTNGGHGHGTEVTDPEIIAAASEAALAEVPGGTVVKVELETHGTAIYEVYLTDADGNKVKVYLDAEFVVVDVVTQGGHKGGHDDQQVTDETIVAAASAAALVAVPGGTVLGVYTEDDHGAAYEVKMTDADGNKVKVYLDAEYNVLDVKTFNNNGHGRGHGRGR